MLEDPSEIPLDKAVEEPPIDIAPRSGPPVWALGVALLLVIGGVAAYLYLRSASRQPAPAARSAVPPAATKAPDAGPQISLPPLDETDTLVRQLVGQLSSHPMVATWLTTDGLIVNFVVVTQRIADGQSPMKELRPMGPLPPFRPKTLRGDPFVDPSSYRRYDRYAEAVAALDARGTARLYTTLKPRIGDAYRRLGQPTGDFDPVLERSIAELLAVPTVQGDIELAPSGIGYAFVDPKLEGLSAAQKQLLRMGPQNIQTVQAKLREIAESIGIPASRLPR